jgi:hypothetical protein
LKVGIQLLWRQHCNPLSCRVCVCGSLLPAAPRGLSVSCISQ